jgi:transcriptional regulator with XRE-family HTH domain
MPRPPLPPTPADIRSVFGQNLRSLCARESSVSDLCRRIGINRTQFNRYLSGEAFPRPDILHRICQHFAVDARILLEPMDRIRSDWRTRAAEMLRDIALPPQARPFDHYLMPDGIYRFWRRSFSHPGRYVGGLWRVHTEDGVKMLKSFDLYPQPVRRGTRRFARKVPYSGVFMQHFDGVSLLCSTGSENILSFTFFEYGLSGLTRFHNGVTMLTRRQMLGASRLSNIVLERFTGDCADLLRMAREVGIGDGDRVPEPVRQALDRLRDDG